MVQHERINFAVSDELSAWIKTQPAIVGVTQAQNKMVLDHNMTPTQLAQFKNDFVNRLSETLPPT